MTIEQRKTINSLIERFLEDIEPVGAGDYPAIRQITVLMEQLHCESTAKILAEEYAQEHLEKTGKTVADSLCQGDV